MTEKDPVAKELARLVKVVEKNTAELAALRADLRDVSDNAAVARARVDRLSLLIEGVRGVVILPAEAPLPQPVLEK